MVTFGVVPGMLMFKMIILSKVLSIGFHIFPTDTSAIAMDNNYFLAYFAFLIPIFSAIRLAKFNNDARQSDSFIGLPTPANAILICSIPLVLEFNHVFVILNPFVLCIVSCVMSLLLVANLPLIALKFKNFTWTDNKIRFTFLGLSIVLLSVFQFLGIPLVIILYILISIVNNIFFKKKV